MQGASIANTYIFNTSITNTRYLPLFLHTLPNDLLKYDTRNLSIPYDLQIPHIHDEQENAFRLCQVNFY